jgi:hypothetical protein
MLLLPLHDRREQDLDGIFQLTVPAARQLVWVWALPAEVRCHENPAGAQRDADQALVCDSREESKKRRNLF